MGISNMEQFFGVTAKIIFLVTLVAVFPVNVFLDKILERLAKMLKAIVLQDFFVASAFAFWWSSLIVS